MTAAEERYVFIVEWNDVQASIIRIFNLTYYLNDNTIDMYDLKNKRIFLKRTAYKGVAIEELNVGCIVTVYSRQLKVIEYADEYTRIAFEAANERTFAMIKPDAYLNIGKILTMIYQAGFKIHRLKMSRFNESSAGVFYGEHKGKHFYQGLQDFVTSDVCVGMELVREDAILAWRELLGPTNTQRAQEEAPDSIRALFGTDGTRNACHGSDSPVSASRELDIFFGDYNIMPSTSLQNNCTCGIIKPHVVKSHLAGELIQQILDEGFEISAMQIFSLDTPTAEECLEVYKGVLPEFQSIVEEITTGPCIVMEIRQEDVVEGFRKLCGPHDPEIAKSLRPNTLRARFGMDRTFNAIQCTDLEEDGVSECEYFFDLLKK
jgi:nucleoside-diphosphate kinase